MQETRVLVETRGTTDEETTSYWFDLPIDVAEFEEKLGIGAESGDYRIIEKVLPYADEVHEHTSVYQLNELDFMYRQLSSDMQDGDMIDSQRNTAHQSFFLLIVQTFQYTVVFLCNSGSLEDGIVQCLFGLCCI